MILEDTPITTPKTTEISDFIKNDYKSKQGVATIPEDGTVATFANSLAGIYILIYRFGTWAFKQIFFNTANAFYKKERLREEGLHQGEGVKAVLNSGLTGGTPLAVLPAGTFYEYEDLIFKTLSDHTMTGGGLLVPVQALDVGSIYNLPATGTKLTIVSPLTGVPATLTVVEPQITEGQDPESNEAYFERGEKAIQIKPQGGSPGDYFQWSTEVQGIVCIALYTLTTGGVNVYPIATGTGNDRIPSALQLQEVADSIDTSGNFVYHDRKPITAGVTVSEIFQESYKVEIDGFIANGGTNAIKDLIDAEIEKYIDTRRPENKPLGVTGGESEVAVNAVFTIVNSITNPYKFTVDDVRVFVFDGYGTYQRIAVKRPLPPATLGLFDTVDYVS